MKFSFNLQETSEIKGGVRQFRGMPAVEIDGENRAIPTRVYFASEKKDSRLWYQKLFGYCPCCGRWFQKIELRDGCMVCKDCHEEHEAWKQEMQVDFRKSRL